MVGWKNCINYYFLIGTTIIENIKNSASQWVNGKDPDDDVTFVVIKVK